MSPEPWQNALRNRLRSCAADRIPRVVIAGIGNDLRGDDRAGLEVVRRVCDAGGDDWPYPQCLLVEAQNAPESHAGPMRRFAPDLVLFVDVAWLGLPPGSVRLIPWEETTGLSASTHTFPLHLLARYLHREAGCDVLLLGIQPQSLELGEALSSPVQLATDDVAEGLLALIAETWSESSA